MKLTLRAIRATKRLSQVEAAKAVGISEFTWLNYEKGRTYPSVPVIKKIEKVFNVKFDDIIFLTPNTVKLEKESKSNF